MKTLDVAVGDVVQVQGHSAPYLVKKVRESTVEDGVMLADLVQFGGLTEFDGLRLHNISKIFAKSDWVRTMARYWAEFD